MSIVAAASSSSYSLEAPGPITSRPSIAAKVRSNSTSVAARVRFHQESTRRSSSKTSRSRWLGRALTSSSSGPRETARVPRTAVALFTGIVEEMGRVRGVQVDDDGGCEMTVAASVVLEDVKLGDSIAVNGTCLTVTAFDSSAFVVGLSPETLRRTSLGEVGTGSSVNLERSVQPTSRMGGHFVQGHVDGTGTIASMESEGNSLWVKVKTSPELMRYIVPKGYIAVDGTSLTVVDVLDEECCFTFMLVAYTQQKIIIPAKKVGNKVNLEVDILGKYVERMVQGYSPATVLKA